MNRINVAVQSANIREGNELWLIFCVRNESVRMNVHIVLYFYS